MKERVVVLPIVAGTLDLNIASVFVKPLEMSVDYFFSIPSIFVQDSDCIM